MYKLVIAKDFECRKFIKLMEGSYEEISAFTSKYLSSSDIRKKFKKEYNTFYRTFKDKGDIVIIDENGKRYRVLYKDDIYAVKTLLLDQNFMRYVIKNRFVSNTSEFDNYIINARKTSNYKRHLNNYINSRKDTNDFYATIRLIEIAYEYYRNNNQNKPTLDKIKKDCQNKRKIQAAKRLQTIKEEKERLELQKELSLEPTNPSEMYENINNLSSDEIYSVYSLDELLTNLSYDECKNLEIGTCKR